MGAIMIRAAARLALVAVMITVSGLSVATASFATDGGVSMSIAGVDCGHRAATGEYCYVTFRAVNVSDGFPVFTEADQIAYDTAGRAFHPDSAAGVVPNRGKPVTQRLQRGPVVSGILVFALPAGDRIARVVLHGKTGTPGEVFPVPSAN
jgi:hypothetical protein